MKNVRILLAIAVCIAALSSCKKDTVTSASTLESHKWVVTSDVTSYSDSVVTHNNLHPSPTCLDTTYFEFQDYTPNNAVRTLYQYTSEHCTNVPYNSPNIQTSTWALDKDNANLSISGTWYGIKSLSGSALVLTQVSEQYLTTTGIYPNTIDVYHTVTETITFSAQ